LAGLLHLFKRLETDEKQKPFFSLKMLHPQHPVVSAPAVPRKQQSPHGSQRALAELCQLRV